MEDYIIIGIIFSCISVFSNLLALRYFNKSETSHAVTNNNTYFIGMMFAWLICWPALLVFIFIKIVVFVIRMLIK